MLDLRKDKSEQQNPDSASLQQNGRLYLEQLKYWLRRLPQDQRFALSDCIQEWLEHGPEYIAGEMYKSLTGKYSPTYPNPYHIRAETLYIICPKYDDLPPYHDMVVKTARQNRRRDAKRDKKNEHFYVRLYKSARVLCSLPDDKVQDFLSDVEKPDTVMEACARNMRRIRHGLPLRIKRGVLYMSDSNIRKRIKAYQKYCDKARQ